MSALFAIKGFILGWRTFRGRTTANEFRWAIAFSILFFLPSLYFDLDLFTRSQTYKLDPEWAESSGFLENPASIDVTQLPADAVIGVETKFSLLRFNPSLWFFAPAIMLSVPLFAVLTRRLHDIGYPGLYGAAACFFAFFLVPTTSVLLGTTIPTSGTAIFLVFISSIVSWIVSVIALIVLVMWAFAPSDPDRNRYGPNPNEVTP